MVDVYQILLRSGLAADVDTFTGGAGELTYDTDTGQVRVHDGVTAGGTKIPQADGTGTFGALIADSLNKAAIGTTNANTGTFTVLTADSLDGAAIGSSNANTGNFTSLTATSLSVPSINGPSIGVSLANTGNFTSLTATSLSVPSINGPSIGDTLANTGAFTSLSATSLSVPSINGPSIGDTLANTGTFTVLTATSLSVPSINGPSIGNSLANTGAFTVLTADSITKTGTLNISATDFTISTGGSESVRITSGGLVGIGAAPTTSANFETYQTNSSTNVFHRGDNHGLRFGFSGSDAAIDSVTAGITDYSPLQINAKTTMDLRLNSAAVVSLTTSGATVTGTAVATQGMPIVTNSANTKTLALTDSGSYIRFSNTTITVVTIPTNATVAFPTGAEVTGTGVANTVSIANSAGVTLNSKESLVTASAGGAFFLKKVGTNEWDLHGALE